MAFLKTRTACYCMSMSLIDFTVTPNPAMHMTSSALDGFDWYSSVLGLLLSEQLK